MGKREELLQKILDNVRGMASTSEEYEELAKQVRDLSYEELTLLRVEVGI